MIKLSKLTDYAVVILAEMTRMRGQTVSAAALAGKIGLPEPTVSKILKLLARQELLTSTRGTSGGYRLEREAASIPVTDIIAAIEGPISLTACTEGSHDNCALETVCALNGRWTPVNKALQAALAQVTLAQMTGKRV